MCPYRLFGVAFVLLALCAAQDDGVTPLTLACRLGKATVVKMLLEMRADPNQPDVSMHGSPPPTHPSAYLFVCLISAYLVCNPTPARLHRALLAPPPPPLSGQFYD